MTRPSSERTTLERYEDVTLIWIEEWLLDVLASLSVMHGMVNTPSLRSVKLSRLEPHFTDSINGVETLINEVKIS